MVEPQTVSEVLKKLELEGYTEGFRAQGECLLATPSNIELRPEQLTVDKVYRFEGESNIDDEEIVFALSCSTNGIRGTYIVAYGPMMHRRDADLVQRLHKRYNETIAQGSL